MHEHIRTHTLGLGNLRHVFQRSKSFKVICKIDVSKPPKTY